MLWSCRCRRMSGAFFFGNSYLICACALTVRCDDSHAETWPQSLAARPDGGGHADAGSAAVAQARAAYVVHVPAAERVVGRTEGKRTVLSRACGDANVAQTGVYLSLFLNTARSRQK